MSSLRGNSAKGKDKVMTEIERRSYKVGLDYLAERR